jgi:hypothetical protein
MLCSAQLPQLLLQLCMHPGRVSSHVCLQQVGSSTTAAALLQEVLSLWPQQGSSSSTVVLQLPGSASRRLPSAHVTLWVWPQGSVTQTASGQLTRGRSDLLWVQGQRRNTRNIRAQPCSTHVLSACLQLSKALQALMLCSNKG